MASEPVNTASGPGADGSPAASKDTTQDNPVRVSHFAIPGKTPTSSNARTDNPEGTTKEPKAPETGNPEKKPETTSASGSAPENKDGQPTGQKLYADKYKTVEELEKGYGESVSERAREKAEWERQMSELRSQVASTSKQPRGEDGKFVPTTKDSNAAPTDFLEQPEVKKALETIREVGGDELGLAINTLLGAQAKHLTAGREADRAELEEVKLGRLTDEFYAENPDAKELKVDMDNLGAEVLKKADDSKFFMSILYLAAKGKKVDDIVKTSVANTETRIRKEYEDKERALRLAGGVTVGSPGSGGAIDGGDGERKSHFAMPARRR